MLQTVVDSLIKISRKLRYLFYLVFTPLFQILAPVVLQKCLGISLNNEDKTSLVVHNPFFYAKVLAYGEIGFGEAYADGWISVGNLRAFYAKLITHQNTGRLLKMMRWTLPFWETRIKWLAINRPNEVEEVNSISEECINLIAKGESSISPGYIGWGAKSPAESQIHKYQLVAQHLGLTKGMKVLDIGCGFGAMLKYFNIHYGITGVGTTKEKHGTEGALHNCGGTDLTFFVSDWKDIPEDKYDAVVCVDMLEFVAKWDRPEFFRKINSLLNPGAKMFLQVWLTEDYVCLDFQNTYIYGQMMSLSTTELIQHIRGTMKLVQFDDVSTSLEMFLNLSLSNIEDNKKKVQNFIGCKKTGSLFHVFSVWEAMVKAGRLGMGHIILGRYEDRHEISQPFKKGLNGFQ